nr:10242_t:CDS:10 [Entrophospora candida]
MSFASEIDFSAMSFKEIDEYSVDDVLTYLKDNIKGSLDEDDLGILKKNKIDGAALLLLTEEKLLHHPYNLAGGPASKIAAEIGKINDCFKKQTIYCVAHYRNHKKIFHFKTSFVKPSWSDLQKKIMKEMEDFEEENIRIKSKSFEDEITSQDTFDSFMESIETTQRDYSYFTTIKKIAKIFGISANEISDLDEINLPTRSDINNSEIKEVINDTFKRIKAIKKSSIDISQANEMERSLYIEAILRGVANTFLDIILHLQFYISGPEGKGRVDFAASNLQQLICVTEAKRFQIEEGISNNFIQLQSACKESPIEGAIRISLKAPDKFSEVSPTYCNNNNSVPCIYWGSNEIHYPSDGAGFAFFTTRVNINRHFPPANCSFLKNYDKSCIVDPRQKPDNVLVQSMLDKSYIADIEKYTIMVEHSIRGKITTKTYRNGLLNGQLLSSDGETVIKSWTNETRTLNDPRADGDIMTVGELLQAAGADLEGISGAPGADPDETFRSAGIVIVIIIDYKNNVLNPDEINYQYLPQVIGGSRYKTVESIYNVADGSYIIKNRHGIRITFKQYGKIGEFDFISLLINLVAAITLFRIDILGRIPYVVFIT